MKNIVQIITTNINSSQWDDVFGDSLIASAIVDRLLHHSHVAKITGNSYRLKDFFKKQMNKMYIFILNFFDIFRLTFTIFYV